MVRFLSRGHSLERLLRCTSRKMLEAPARDAEGASCIWQPGAAADDRNHGGQFIGSALDRHWPPKPRIGNDGEGTPSDMKLMKERFAKLLLGEDMSGGGKGVSSALALSNAITNLAASIFGEQWRLEPVSVERKSRWRKEIDWILSVADHIVEFIPSRQTSKDGTNMEIMVTQQRIDLHMNIPALRKLDAMLFGYLDNFKDQNEFWYAPRGDDAGDKERRKDDKWWLPAVKIPASGLSEVSRKWLQYQKELVNQVLKASMAINAQVLTEMAIPDAYIESLPKNGRASLGDATYKGITVDVFDPEEFLSSNDLSTEHKVLDLKNRIEASIVIWKRKMNNKDGKSSWGLTVSMEKREQFEERSETILILLKQRFPGIPQSALDISKIQYNRDVGQSILESYSRILESLAFTVMSRIEDVLDADAVARGSPQGGDKRHSSSDPSDPALELLRKLDPSEELEKLGSMDAPASMTLSDFMGWHFDPDADSEKNASGGPENGVIGDLKLKSKPVDHVKKFSYIDKLEALGGLRSPTARH